MTILKAAWIILGLAAGFIACMLLVQWLLLRFFAWIERSEKR